MKRDFDLIRQMLLRIESQPADAKITNSTFSDLCADNALISFHISLLRDEGWVIAAEIPKIRQHLPDYWILRLTAAGCDYLDAVRNDSIWDKTKRKIGEISETMPAEIIQSVAVDFIREALHL